jgi:hypothetical protein
LSAREEFGGGEIFQVFMIRNHINRKCGAFKVVSPSLERVEDGKKFLIMDIVVEFRGR